MKHSQDSRAGSGLIVAMIVLVTVMTLVGVALSLTSTFTRQASRQRTVLHTQSGADSAVEYVYAKWKQNIKANAYAPVATSSFALPSTLHPALSASPSSGTGQTPVFNPWPISFPTAVSYTTTDPWGVTTANPTSVNVTNVPGYPGWSGKSYFYKAEASTTAAGGISQGVRRYLQLTVVPLFQAAIFYEDKLEIHPGPDMTVSGLVHTNGDLEVLAYNSLKFLDNVSFTGNYLETAQGNWSGTGATSGYSNPTQKPFWQDDQQSDASIAKQTQLQQVDRMEPLGTRPAQVFDTTDTNPNNDGFREIIEKPNSSYSDPPEIASTRLYNKASLKIEVDSSKAASDPNYLKVYNYNGTKYSTSSQVHKKVNDAVVGSTTMYDQRETTNVKVTTVDMDKFNKAIDKMDSDYNGVVYITDTSTDAAKDAIRLVEGRDLDYDMTIATDEGMYIQGDFNTGGNNPNDVPSNGSTPGGSNVANGYNEKSVAVAADAVTVLSNNWNDANANKQLNYRAATNTTVNAGILTGNVPTNENNNGNPSGGVHNLPRFLEMWINPSNYNGVNFTYYGSMVQLFKSKSFTGLWYTNNTYWPPNRIWNFDTLFKTEPPPGSLQATQLSRGRWERL